MSIANSDSIIKLQFLSISLLLNLDWVSAVSVRRHNLFMGKVLMMFTAVILDQSIISTVSYHIHLINMELVSNSLINMEYINQVPNTRLNFNMNK